MTPTLIFITQSIVSIFLIYFALSATFRYHISMNRVFFFFFACFCAIGLLLVDESLLWFLLPLGILILLCVIGLVLSIKYKRHGLFILHVYRHQETFHHEVLEILQNDYHMPAEQLLYCKKKPFLYVIKGMDIRSFLRFQKQIDKLYVRHIVTSFWAKYLPIIFVLIILAAYWRY